MGERLTKRAYVSIACRGLQECGCSVPEDSEVVRRLMKVYSYVLSYFRALAIIYVDHESTKRCPGVVSLGLQPKEVEWRAEQQRPVAASGMRKLPGYFCTGRYGSRGTGRLTSPARRWRGSFVQSVQKRFAERYTTVLVSN